jgi:hypothetical protein
MVQEAMALEELPLLAAVTMGRAVAEDRHQVVKVMAALTEAGVLGLSIVAEIKALAAAVLCVLFGPDVLVHSHQLVQEVHK